MARPRFEYCPICAIRATVEARLNVPAYKPGSRGLVESPTAFWARIEGAGLLPEALAIYDKAALEHKARAHTLRETKWQFDLRVRAEGRQAEADRLRAELLAQGLSQRDAQERLVQLLQPVSGDATRAWQTPNPWNEGRICRRKADQDRLLALKGSPPSKDEIARRRLRFAEHRLEERQALVNARRRAQALKAAPPMSTDNPTPPAPSPPKVSDLCLGCYQRGGAHRRDCANYVEGKTPSPCQDCTNGIVTPSSVTYNWNHRNLCDSCYAKGRKLGWS
jgi:hypothetical protein